jgi:hypothetical protein
MGFNLIHYVSNSHSSKLWSDANKKAGFSFEGLKTELSLSFTPHFDVLGEWKKGTENESEQKGNQKIENPTATMIVASSELALWESDSVGTVEDLINGNFKNRCFKLDGNLFLKKDRSATLKQIEGISIAPQILNAQIKLPDSKIMLDVVLSLNNVLGMTYVEQAWRVLSGGTWKFINGGTSKEGYPIFGLFVIEKRVSEKHYRCGVLYLASTDELRWLKHEKGKIHKRSPIAIFSRGLPDEHLKIQESLE